jgi:hypothetical protein
MGAVIGTLLAEAGTMAAWSVRLAVAAIFLEAAQHALSDRPAFATIVGAYRILPQALAGVAALLLPVVQIAAAFALMVPRATLPGSGLALLLLLLFTTAICVNLRRGRDNIDCGCGGDSQRISRALVVRNLVLMAALAGTLAAPAHVVFAPALAVGVAGFAVFLTGLYFAANQLLGNAQSFAAAARRMAA